MEVFREEVLRQAEPACGNGPSSDTAILWTQGSSHLLHLPAASLPPARSHLSSPSPRPGSRLPDPGGAPNAMLPMGLPPSFPLLLTALPTPVSGLIKELCSLFMYGPSLIGVFVFPHYSQLDRAV